MASNLTSGFNETCGTGYTLVDNGSAPERRTDGRIDYFERGDDISALQQAMGVEITGMWTPEFNDQFTQWLRLQQAEAMGPENADGWLGPKSLAALEGKIDPEAYQALKNLYEDGSYQRLHYRNKWHSAGLQEVEETCTVPDTVVAEPDPVPENVEPAPDIIDTAPVMDAVPDDANGTGIVVPDDEEPVEVLSDTPVLATPDGDTAPVVDVAPPEGVRQESPADEGAVSEDEPQTAADIDAAQIGVATDIINLADGGLDIASAEALAESLRAPRGRDAFEGALDSAVAMGELDPKAAEAIEAELDKFYELEETRKTLDSAAPSAEEPAQEAGSDAAAADPEPAEPAEPHYTASFEYDYQSLIANMQESYIMFLSNQPIPMSDEQKQFADEVTSRYQAALEAYENGDKIGAIQASYDYSTYTLDGLQHGKMANGMIIADPWLGMDQLVADFETFGAENGIDLGKPDADQPAPETVPETVPETGPQVALMTRAR